MSTILYPSPIFGPIHSRRLGVSLGVNLMPNDGKVCTFDCLYCECGFNKDHVPHHPRPTVEQVTEALAMVLGERHRNGEPLDTITFSGNGEPTLHPDFPTIIENTLRERDLYFPEAKVSVLSNATMVQSEEVRKALMKVDNNIQKLDTVNMDYIRTVDRPTQQRYDVAETVECLKAFNGNVVIQTMFMKGTTHGISVDNTSDEYLLPWLDALRAIQPRQVMVYTIDRETPETTLQKVESGVLDAIKARVEQMGIKCSASY